MPKSKATFYDGKSSYPREVEVSQVSDHLYLQFQDEWDEMMLSYAIDQIEVLGRTSKDRVTLKLDDTPKGPTLEWIGPDALAFASQRLSESNKIGFLEYFVTHKSPMAVVAVGILLIIGLIWLYTDVVSPRIAEAIVISLPPEIEEKTGASVMNQVTYLYTIDSTKSVLLQEFFDLLGYPSEYHVQMHYMNDRVTNAFALPGGQIVVFDGLVKTSDDWQELAAVLGHELAHVNQQHSFKQIARSTSSYMLISMISGDVAGVSAVLIENASRLQNLANSRKYEKEADMYGVRYMTRAQVSPYRLIDFFESMEKETGDTTGHSAALEFFSTHPLSDNRITYLQQEIEKASPDTSVHHPNEARLQSIYYKLKNDSAGVLIAPKVRDLLQMD